MDEAALQYDLAYSKHDDLQHRNKADKEMIHNLLSIGQPTCRERCAMICIAHNVSKANYRFTNYKIAGLF